VDLLRVLRVVLFLHKIKVKQKKHLLVLELVQLAGHVLVP